MKHQKRTARIAIRVTPETKHMIQCLAEQRQLSVSAFLQQSYLIAFATEPIASKFAPRFSAACAFINEAHLYDILDE